MNRSSNATGAAALVPHLATNSTIKLIGVGGVGGIVARYGALFLASLDQDSRLVLIDGDRFEPGNTGRMVFTTYDNKAAAIREDLLRFLARSKLTVTAVEEHIDESNMARLIGEEDTVILAVDNHATRKLVSDYCSALHNVCLISGGNDGVEKHADGKQLRGTYGNCQIHVRRAGFDVTPSLCEYHPEIREPVDHLPTEVNCIEAAADSAPQILFANLQTATVILNAFWLYLCNALHYPEVCFDIADALMRPVKYLPPQAPAIASTPPATSAHKSES